AMLLATSLVAVVQLISASIVWTYAVHVSGAGLTPEMMSTIVSLSGGAMLANIVSVMMLMIETAMMKH
ncbi:MAG: DUF6394 family protein, partial [Gammaproteobacteria bacterium]